ncbi:MAG: hypothetical protein R3220_12680 [Balneolaceae bacterium]|nr:hypothetical protein [Balneolaceae bacterium]
MDDSTKKTTIRLGSYSALVAALFMIAGAVLKVTSGADLDVALTNGSPAEYLAKLSDVRYMLVMNLSFWIVGVFFLGVAGSAMAKLCEQSPVTAGIIKLGYFTGVPLAIVSFIAWLTLVVQLNPNASQTEIKIFEVIGWFVSRADWTATILVVGVGPAMISYSGRGDWVPGWLSVFGIFPAIASILTAIAMFTNALTTYGFAIVPIGLLWMIAAGMALFGHLKS